MSDVVMERPDVLTDEHLTYLDELRESGATNMFAAVPYLRSEFGLSRRDAETVLSHWMHTFSARRRTEAQKKSR